MRDRGRFPTVQSFSVPARCRSKNPIAPTMSAAARRPTRTFARHCAGWTRVPAAGTYVSVVHGDTMNGSGGCYIPRGTGTTNSRSEEFCGGFVDFLLGRGGRHPR